MIRRTLVAMSMAWLLILQASGLSEQTWPNVLVIVLDDLGTDQLEFYNTTPCCTLPATPNLDNLRSQGILFTQAHGNPVCSATRACIQTGRYGLRTGVGDVTNSTNPGQLEFELDNGEVLLAELVTNGRPTPLVKYKCGAFGKWHLSTSTDYSHPTDNGYHRFQGTVGNVSLGGNHFSWWKVDNQNPNSPILVSGGVTREYWQSSVASDNAADWINAQTKPFLAYVCFNAPHWPLQVPPMECFDTNDPNGIWQELMTANLMPGNFVSDPTTANGKLVYRAMIEAVDYEIGNLVTRIYPNKYSNTMVFVIGDNGTEQDLLCQCIQFSPCPPPPPSPPGGKATLYETGIRIPLIVSGPLVPPLQMGQPPWESDALVDAVDLWRTIANITSSSVSAANPLNPLDGKSFLSVIQNPGSPGPRTHTFSQIFNPNGPWPPQCGSKNQRSVSNGLFKLVRAQVQDPTTMVCSWQDYVVDLVNDPDELCNLGTSHPAYPGLLQEMINISGP